MNNIFFRTEREKMFEILEHLDMKAAGPTEKLCFCAYYLPHRLAVTCIKRLTLLFSTY